MQSYKRIIIPLFLILMGSLPLSAQLSSLRKQIKQVIRGTQGKIGVAIQGWEETDTLSIDGYGKYPMQSVYKFPLALAILEEVEKGTYPLDQPIQIKKNDLRPDTWSPLREKYSQGGVSLSLDELLKYTVSQSDNNGCDILFRFIGGPKKVDRYIHDLGVSGISIVATEKEMAGDWDVQYLNWCSPVAMCQLLHKFYSGQILTKNSSNYLLHLMMNSTTGSRRIKGLLPYGVTVAHKTGASGTNQLGIAAATNDAGIVMLPDGKYFIIVVFISNSGANEAARDEVIAKIAKLVWDYFNT